MTTNGPGASFIVCRGACAGVVLALTLAWCMPASAAEDAVVDENAALTALEPATTVADDAQAEPAPTDPAAPAPPDPGTTPAPTATTPDPDPTAAWCSNRARSIRGARSSATSGSVWSCCRV